MADLVAFGIIIDDLVFPDGHTAMGVLGGGGPQTAFGMRLPTLAEWSQETSVGLVAGVGHDLPQSAWAWMHSVGIDLAGVRVANLPTPRAWQVIEADGRRTQVWRMKGDALGAQLGRTSDHIPARYRTALGFHLGIHPDEPDLDFIDQLRTLRPSNRPMPNLQLPASDLRFPVISLELFKSADQRLSDAALRQLCSAADIFSPNLAEAQSLVGNGSPDELVRRLAGAGARILALRMGAEGSLAYDGLRLYHVPCVPTTAVDTTGAGNAFCGGFLAGYAQTGDVLTAARYGTIAASFLVEQVGLPPINDRLCSQAHERLRWLGV